MRILSSLLHFYSYLFHAILALILIGISAVALLSGAPNFHLSMLPGNGISLAQWLLLANGIGLAAVILAATRKFRPLYVLYALVVLGMTIRGFFLAPYSYGGADEFRLVLWFLAGALLATWGSFSQLRTKKTGY